MAYNQQYPPPSHSPHSPHGYPPAQGHSPYPPPPGGYYPPQQPGTYGYPPAPPAPPAPYGGSSPGYPYAQQYPPQQGYGPPYGPPQGPPQYPPQYGAPYPPVAPAMPSLEYVPGQVAPGDFRADAEALRKAMKGFGTDEATLIRVLSRLDPLQVAAVREAYSRHIGRDLYKDVKSETSGYFQQGLLAIIEGPLMYDAELVRDAVKGLGTKEWLLNDVLLGRSNADLNAIKNAYQHKFQRSLQRDVQDDLSAKTEGLFTKVISATRHEESAPINSQYIESETKSIYDATQGRIINNVGEVCAIFAQSSDNELRAINQAFNSRYNTSLEKHIERQFSGHMKDALLYMLRTALDPAMRGAVLLEECMKGAGTKDYKLVVRIVRLHWNRQHLDQVKRAYQHRYHRDLRDRVRGETSGDYQRLMLALLE
ncbi:hypothetical protein VTN77DRAFT_6995 [Rasamsonia byssochlamydoides]|uniref:uncharacterized protein n=1 Tax=Rasamsonia byssochlamydoides TaxID=89139 RepID=UPI0037442B23